MLRELVQAAGGMDVMNEFLRSNMSQVLGSARLSFTATVDQLRAGLVRAASPASNAWVETYVPIADDIPGLKVSPRWKTFLA